MCKGYLERFIRKHGYNIIFNGIREKQGVTVVVVVMQEVFSYEVLVSNQSVPGFANGLESQ